MTDDFSFSNPDLHDRIRNHMLRNISFDPVGDKAEDIETVKATQWSDEFEQLMRNRLMMGRYRYARLDQQPKGCYDNLRSAIKRLKMCIVNGNLEHVVDAAALCLVEYVNGDHPNRHFEAADDGIHTEKKK